MCVPLFRVTRLRPTPFGRTCTEFFNSFFSALHSEEEPEPRSSSSSSWRSTRKKKLLEISCTTILCALLHQTLHVVGEAGKACLRELSAIYYAMKSTWNAFGRHSKAGLLLLVLLFSGEEFLIFTKQRASSKLKNFFKCTKQFTLKCALQLVIF